MVTAARRVQRPYTDEDMNMNNTNKPNNASIQAAAKHEALALLAQAVSDGSTPEEAYALLEANDDAVWDALTERGMLDTWEDGTNVYEAIPAGVQQALAHWSGDDPEPTAPYSQAIYRIDVAANQCSTATAMWAEPHDWFIGTTTTPDHKLAIRVREDDGSETMFTSVSKLVAWVDNHTKK